MRAALAALIAVALPGGAVAQTRCLATAEAEAITLVALPEIVREAGRSCPALPAASLVRRTASPFLSRYDAEADRAWPVARTALSRLADPQIAPFVTSDYARPLLTTILVGQIAGRIQASDCPTIDRLVTLLEPLPPKNTAGIVVATMQYLRAEKAKGRAGTADVPDLPVCPAAAGPRR